MSDRKLSPSFLLALAAVLAACGTANDGSNPGTSGGGQSGNVGVAGSSGSGAGVAGSGGTPIMNGGSGGVAVSGGAGGSSGHTQTNAGTTSAAGASTAGASGSEASGGAGSKCPGNALSLEANGTGMASDAAQARVVIDLKTDTPLGAANRSVAFWAYIKPTDWVGERNELFYSGGDGTNTTFGLDFGTNPVLGMPDNHATLDPFTNGSLSVDSTADLGVTSAAAHWLHIALTWDGGAMKTYVNGTLRITSVANAQLATASGPFVIGCNPANSYCFNGSFDELSIWNRALPEAELKSMYDHVLKGDEQGLVGYWKFDEQPGATVAADSVKSAGHVAHPGTLMADSVDHDPKFVTPMPAPPLVCP
jgi:hypothetical protein